MSSLANQITNAFLYIEDTRPVLVFDTADNAAAFIKAYGSKDAEVYADPTHVFLRKPHGVELAAAGHNGGAFAYVFHNHLQAAHWAKKMGAYAVIDETKEHNRTVYVGRKVPIV
jgi:hypothetical protein